MPVFQRVNVPWLVEHFLLSCLCVAEEAVRAFGIDSRMIAETNRELGKVLEGRGNFTQAVAKFEEYHKLSLNQYVFAYSAHFGRKLFSLRRSY